MKKQRRTMLEMINPLYIYVSITWILKEVGVKYFWTPLLLIPLWLYDMYELQK